MPKTKKPIFSQRAPTLDVLCEYHNNDGDLRGWRLEAPVIHCPACRGAEEFSVAEVEEYLKDAKEASETFTEVVLGKSTIRVFPPDRWTTVTPSCKVELIKGNWPSDEDLLTACGDHPFGGSVSKTSNQATVTRYLD